jgi:hypothetical protein
MKHHSPTHTFSTCQNIYAVFHAIILLTFIASLACLTDLFYKLQDHTVKQLYEPGAVAQGLDTQKKLAEETVTVHSRATRWSEGYSDLDIGISTLCPCSKGMELCMSFYTTWLLNVVISTHKV